MYPVTLLNDFVIAFDMGTRETVTIDTGIPSVIGGFLKVYWIPSTAPWQA